jgi:hypothetical protein
MATETMPAADKQSAPLLSRKLLLEIIELCLIGMGIFAMIRWLPRRYFLDGNV